MVISIYLPKELSLSLREEAAKLSLKNSEHVSVSKIVRELIDNYFDEKLQNEQSKKKLN